MRRRVVSVTFWASLLIGAYFLASPAYSLKHFQSYAAEWPHFVRYVLVPGAIGLAFIAVALLAGPNTRGKVSTYGVTVLAALFMLEAVLSWRQVPLLLGSLGQLEESEQADLAQDENFLRGFTLRQVNHLANSQTLQEAVVTGFPNNKIILCSRDNELITYQADRYGFNNPDQIYAEPVDVMLLGDSFVEGFCLPNGQDIAAQMRADGTHAMSAGMRGNGPMMALATLGRYGPTLKPKHIVMAFYEGNDWRNFGVELTDAFLRDALVPGADFGSSADASETSERGKAALAALSKDEIGVTELLRDTPLVRNFFALHHTMSALGIVYPRLSPERPEYVVVLERAKALAESWGGRFHILYIPRIDRFMGALASDGPFDPLRRMVLAAAREADVDVIDLVEMIRAGNRPGTDFYAKDGHFSELGTSLAAKATIEALYERHTSRLQP